MKIFFPFQTKDIGGTSTFAKKFKAGMEADGHEVFSEYRSDYDVLFLIVQAPFSYLWDAKRKGKKIVQRLDGVYYWSIAGWKYPLYNLKAFLIRHLFADVSIYQSEYSKQSVDRFLWRKKNERATTIYNGVDTSLFSPDGPSESFGNQPDQKIVFSASEFRRTDQIIPILSSIDIYRKRFGTDVKLVLAGTFHRELSGFEAELQQYPWVQFLGKIPNAELPRYLRAADVFIFTHLNPPCPNNILEAMACGLPVAGIADGSMPELITPGTDGYLLKTVGDAFWKRRAIEPEAFATVLHTTITDCKRLGQNARGAALNRFSLDSMIDRYIAALTSL